MLKQQMPIPAMLKRFQPPSGGCVLKLLTKILFLILLVPAAFGRLCVETSSGSLLLMCFEPAAFGRLCVETG